MNTAFRMPSPLAAARQPWGGSWRCQAIDRNSMPRAYHLIQLSVSKATYLFGL